MPSSYTLYEMEAFPRLKVGESINAEFQLVLAIDGIDDPPRTSFKLERRKEELPIDVFRVKYESIENRAGRAYGITFEQFIAKFTFPAYYHRNTGLMMIKAKKELARGAIRMLMKGVNDDVRGQSKTLELRSIQPLIERFKGAWFHVIDSADVTSLALFGPSVDLDMRFAQATAEGGIFNMRLDYPYHDEYFHVGISEDSSMVVFGNLDEDLELELVLDVKANLLDRATVLGVHK